VRSDAFWNAHCVTTDRWPHTIFSGRQLWDFEEPRHGLDAIILTSRSRTRVHIPGNPIDAVLDGKFKIDKNSFSVFDLRDHFNVS
jgi:hypothetical protein